MYDLFNMLLNSVRQYFVKDFVSMFISDIGLYMASLFDFGISVMVASQNEFGSLSSSAIFWKTLSRIGVSSSLNFWQNSAVKPSGPGLLFAGRFLITVSISVLVMSLLKCAISSWFSFGKLFLEEFVYLFQIVHFIGIQLLRVVFYDPLYFCVVCCDLSIFTSNIVDLILLPLFLYESD